MILNCDSVTDIINGLRPWCPWLLDKLTLMYMRSNYQNI
jgi:hypothetical protein